MSQEILCSIPLSDRVAIQASFNPPLNFKVGFPNKYGEQGAQEIYNEFCAQGVEKVFQSILELKNREPDFEATHLLLKELLKNLGNIRKNIAQETKTPEAELFGRSRRENPVTNGNATVIDFTSIANPQHFDAHEKTKKLLKHYIELTLNNGASEKEKFYQSISTDNKTNPKSRYVLTIYKQVGYKLKSPDSSSRSGLSHILKKT